MIYTTAKAAGINYYANAISCQLRATSPYRPILGRISYNTDLVANDVLTAAGFQLTCRVAFHELIHILGFSSSLYSYWNASNVVVQRGNRYFI